VAAFALCLVPFFMRFSSLWVLAIYWSAVFVLRRIATAAQHHHAHLSVFGRSSALNFAYDLALGQMTGLITPEWELHHNRGHHRGFLDPTKDLFTAIDRKTGLPMSRLRYSLRSSLHCWGDSIRIAREEGPVENRDLLGRFWLHLGLQAAWIVATVWLNPRMGVTFFVAQTFLVRCSVAWSSYWHHLGVPMTHVYDSSRTMTRPIHNWVSFNSGHHTAHHEKPTLHWSLLPARTQAILHLIPEGCIRNQDAPTPAKWHHKTG
jgi:hypothetical protein